MAELQVALHQPTSATRVQSHHTWPDMSTCNTSFRSHIQHANTIGLRPILHHCCQTSFAQQHDGPVIPLTRPHS